MIILLDILGVALAAWLLVYCYRTWRSERRYLARIKERRQRAHVDALWWLYRESEAETARRLQIARCRAESFRAGFEETAS